MHPLLVDVDAAQGNLAYMSPREQGPKIPHPRYERYSSCQNHLKDIASKPPLSPPRLLTQKNGEGERGLSGVGELSGIGESPDSPNNSICLLQERISPPLNINLRCAQDE